MLAVQIVDLKQVLEDVLEVVKIDEAGRLSHSLINLDYMVDCLDVLMVEKLVDVCIGVRKLSLEVLVGVLEQVVDVDVLLVRLTLLADHPTDTLVHHELLMGLQILQILREITDDGVDKGLSVAVVDLNEHLLCQL